MLKSVQANNSSDDNNDDDAWVYILQSQ